MRLFIGKANCTQCHNGPLLTSNEFHNTGVPPRPELAIDHGRLTGATAVLSDEFNCRSQWSDARERCSELEFIVTGEHTLDRAYKVPSLRNVAERAPYMDAGQFATLAEVLDHYNRAPAAATGHSELRPLRLKPVELRQLEAFLRTLSGSRRCQRTLLRRGARNDPNRRSRHRGDGQRRARRRCRRPPARPDAFSSSCVLATREHAQRLRRCLRKTSGADSGQLRVMASAEVVCVDGVDAVEAVVVRHAPTGRLSAVNASAYRIVRRLVVVALAALCAALALSAAACTIAR